MIPNQYQHLILKYFNPTEPVTIPKNLKGRKQELEEGVIYLLGGDCIIIQGSRRSGKTSLLHCLRALCLENNQRCVYISLQSFEKYNIKTFINHIIQEIFYEFKIPNTTLKEYRLLTYFKKLGLSLQEEVQDNNIIVFIDEFQATEELTHQERTILYNQLRNVIDERVIHPELRKFVFVISTSQSLAELSTGISSTLASAFTKTFTLNNLCETSCYELIQEPFINITQIQDTNIRFIIQETGGHPYLLKLLIYNTFVENTSAFFFNSATLNIQKLLEIQVDKLVSNLSHHHFVMLSDSLSQVELEFLYKIYKHQSLSIIDIKKIFHQNQSLNKFNIIKKILDKLINIAIIHKNHEVFNFSNKIYEKWFASFFKHDYEKFSFSQSIVKFNYMYTENKDLRALVMKGGGVKGLAYLGALKELEKYYHFNWFIGTSAGAIAAILLGAGYSLEELISLLYEKNYRDFLDAKWYEYPTNFIFHRGFFQAHTFTNWIDTLLAQKLDLPVRPTLGDLPNRVTIYASRRGKDALIFDSFDDKYKDTDAAYAVRCSMSIPFIFVPQREAGLRVLDGGMQNNYPVEILLRDNPNLEFLGLYLGSEHYEGQNKEGWLINDILSIWTESSDVKALRTYKDKTVIIDTRPISLIDFGLSQKEKDFLLNTGRVAALKFLFKQGLIENANEIKSEESQVKVDRNHLINKRKKQQQKRAIIGLFVVFIIIILIIIYYLIY